MELPHDFVLQMQDLLGAEAADFFNAANQQPPVSVRFNNKTELPFLEDAVPYCASACYLPQRPSFTLDPWFHAGVYYVQEAGSMYLETLVRKYIKGAVRAIDLCAAPGGKTTHLLSLLSNDSLLISNEVMPQRAHILCENVIKWGHGNVVVTNNQARDFAALGGWADLLLTDVPCSGEGMFRKEPVAVNDWSLEAVQNCAQRQRQILSDVWPVLRQQGLLIYSTCTFNAAEDEENVRWIASELGAELLESRHFYFHTGRNEGFFAAVLRKTAEASKPFKYKEQKHRVPEAPLLNTKHWACIEKAGCLKAVPAAYADEFLQLEKYLRVLQAGFDLSYTKGRDQIPAQALAFSTALDVAQVPIYNLELTDALRYLRGEIVVLPDAPKAYVLLCFRGVPLGWGKNLGNRCNNLYPDLWRIRMPLPSVLPPLPF